VALCDFRTLAPEDGAPTTTYFVDALPEDPFGPVEHLKPVDGSWKVRHNPAHEWWHCPDLTRDEVLMIKLGDTDRTVAWASPHAAFHDPAAHAAVPRHSIEFRTFAYFHEVVLVNHVRPTGQALCRSSRLRSVLYGAGATVARISF
jgi:hypothetical protein